MTPEQFISNEKGYFNFSEALPGDFFGRNREFQKMDEIIEKYGHVAICGCLRTGKTSLALNYLQKNTSLESMRTIALKIFETHPLEILPIDMDEAIQSRVIHGNNHDYLLVDEIARNCKKCVSIVEKIGRHDGLTPIYIFFGDPRMYPAKNDNQKKLFTHLANDCCVVPGLFKDEEMREFLDRKAAFTPWLRDFIVESAGGHISLAGSYASEALQHADRYNSLSCDEVKIELPQMVEINQLQYRFAGSVRIIEQAGFDPLTWENTLHPDINVEIYRQSLPNKSAVHFWKWVEKQIK